MKYTNTLFTTVVIALLATGCVKPIQQTQAQSSQQPVYTEPQQPVYEEASPIVYEDPTPAVTTSSSSVDYNQIPTDNTVITTTGTVYPSSSSSSVTYPQPATSQPVTTSQPVYTNPYETGGGNSYPDPYANNGGGATQPSTPSYSTPSYPAPTSSASAGQGGGGIHLQVAALKDYYAAEQFKNSLSLAPGQSAYVKRGAINKVIVTGISSVAEANRLKNSRFPGAFIVQGGSMSGGGYTPEPSYNSGGGTTYTVNDPYGVPSSSSAGSSYSSSGGIGVQVGAFSSRAKAQEIADTHHGKHPAVVKKIGRYYKVILTGFSSRSSARAYAGRVGGFVVSF